MLICQCQRLFLCHPFLGVYRHIHAYIHSFIYYSNIEMDIINCNHGGLSFLEEIPNITLEKAADGRNGVGQEYTTRWIKG